MKYYRTYLIKDFKITFIENQEKLSGLSMGDIILKDAKEKETVLIAKAYAQMKEYMDGKRTKFELPLAPEGTEFQQKVWQALLSIPYGETRSYKDIAIQIGNEKACRAVGMANNKNPIGIIIPCHRVIGRNGKLTGYAGGLDKKEYLLKLEREING